jgi:hypothetical protein
VADPPGRKPGGISETTNEEHAMSIKSAATAVASATAAALLALSPTPALANAVLHVETGAVETPSTVISLPPGGVIHCTADPAFRFVRPCMIRKG